ncbi:hypothetical protein AMECASPLE_032227 [Ameca splendens]|uniref:Uncharacterized protein n=1 Tax=Ameca splendens TaxID=208324 RepID=A0ABV0ZSF4_9TELE
MLLEQPKERRSEPEVFPEDMASFFQCPERGQRRNHLPSCWSREQKLSQAAIESSFLCLSPLPCNSTPFRPSSRDSVWAE